MTSTEAVASIDAIAIDFNDKIFSDDATAEVLAKPQDASERKSVCKAHSFGHSDPVLGDATADIVAGPQDASEKKSVCKAYSLSHSEPVRSRLSSRSSSTGVLAFRAVGRFLEARREKRLRLKRLSSYKLTLEALLTKDFSPSQQTACTHGEGGPSDGNRDGSSSRLQKRKSLVQRRSYLDCSRDAIESRGNGNDDVQGGNNSDDVSSESYFRSINSMFSDMFEEYADSGETFEVYGNDDNDSDVQHRLVEFEDARRRQQMKQRRYRTAKQKPK
eukprot:TRINITY_DN3491_c0_g2_i1.p1 TRINITY_DN3491_c0_g2~~TRINITY_DN3491_c0_g2_i1.p1  ORF type:complete len:287 (-),score=34.00 TRINITY_DN3491_c0_g2_i1:531-1352(-)